MVYAQADSKSLPLTSEERRRFEDLLASEAEAAKAARREAHDLRVLLQGAQQQLNASRQEVERLKAQVGDSCGGPAPSPATAPTGDGQPPPSAAAVQQAVPGHGDTDARLQRVPDHVPLSQLPAVIQDLHRGMPPDIAAAPMRLVLIQAAVGWGAKLKMLLTARVRQVYEEVAAAECLDMPYTDVPETIWDATVTLSWRWGAQKPVQAQAGFSPMQPSQSEELVAALGRLAGAGFTYVLRAAVLAPSMVEVLRSKVFYARARAMLVLPTFHPLPAEGIIRPLLARTQQQLAVAGAAQEGAGDALAAAAALGSMLAKGHMACREYLSRVWTLAERLARYGRDEPLSCWLGLEAWLGMLLDAVLTAAGVAHACNGHRVDDPKATVALYIKALDAGGVAAEGGTGADSGGGDSAGGGAMVEALVPLLAAGSATGSLLGEGASGLDALLSGLVHTGARVWRLARLGEAPSASWLLGYLADMQAGVYQAWSEPDRLWALYSYFSWKTPDVTSPAALAEAVKDLVAVAGGGVEHLAVAGSKLGLGPRRLAAVAGVLGLGEFEQAERAKATALGQQLLRPTAAGDVAEACRLLSCGADPDADKDGATPLHKAAERGHTEVVKALLAAGAGKDIANKASRWLAVPKGRWQQGRGGGRGGGGELIAGDGATPLHKAASNGHTKVVEALLAAGAGKDIANKDARTPLHKAAERGHTEVVKALLAAGAGKDMANKASRRLADGWTPLHGAAYSGHTEVVKALLAAGAGTDIADKDGATPLYSASFLDRREVVTVLVAAGAGTDIANKLSRRLAVAKGRGQQGRGRWRQRRSSSSGKWGARGVFKGGGGGTRGGDGGGDGGCLHLCSRPAAAPSSSSAAVHLTDPLPLPFHRYPTFQDGDTPLYGAAYSGHTEVVKALVAAGAGTDMANKDGATPLHKAAERGHTEVVRVLVAAGAGKDIANKASRRLADGETPLHKAASNGRTGAVKALLAAGAGTDIADKDGATPLLWAASCGQTEVVQALLAAGAGKDIANKDGATPLHRAASWGHTELVKALVAAGAGTDIADKDGATPLHKAASNGHTEVVRVLVAAGADKDIANKDKRTPLDVTRKDEIRALLRQA
ncbi:hypothetical protein HXX76_014365 [Chlamydomonas incerta]|uniref:Flagellar associated protein n=1 Tax=Chlamydomonas incerta TaxID=51695 RepID=A0A835SQD7_CHLIN|nr:hypothetical protein HXX76_014365 [Chlamydomonas incerta]|eukprot:KAG2424640.1 hypothetical protein HXX76_014365 [Chlamydomonas incerta]